MASAVNPVNLYAGSLCTSDSWCGRHVSVLLIVDPLRTLLWYVARTALLPELLRQLARQIRGKQPYHRLDALARCEAQAISVDDALGYFGSDHRCDDTDSDLRRYERAAKERVSSIEGLMGGGANLDLLYGLARSLKPQKVLETGVAFGWSTLALLSATRDTTNSRVVSVDMPYVKRNLRKLVGAVVPEDLRQRWTLIRRADREGIPKALRILDGLDFAHYDSDKTPEGRLFSYPLIWKSLRPGGVLISDDISDNTAFFRFSEDIGVKPIVIALDDKFAGVLVKP